MRNILIGLSSKQKKSANKADFLNSGDVLAYEDEIAKMRKEETNMFSDDVVVKSLKEVVAEAE